jgi:hypothetical protein
MGGDDPSARRRHRLRKRHELAGQRGDIRIHLAASCIGAVRMQEVVLQIGEQEGRALDWDRALPKFAA